MDRTFFLVYGICDKEITMLSIPYAMHDCETFMITRLGKTINQFRGCSFNSHLLNRILIFMKKGKNQDGK